MGRYTCWGDDHEDLTDQVRMKVLVNGVGTLRIDVMRLSGDNNPDYAGPWRVTGVKCSQGHDNSFEGNGVP